MWYTKPAKAMKKALVVASQTQKSPVRGFPPLNGGFLRSVRLYRRFIQPSSHLLI